MLVASIVPHVSSWLQSQVGASALGALAQRESTCLAGKGSAVRIRHAPPSNSELRFGTRSARVPESGTEGDHLPNARGSQGTQKGNQLQSAWHWSKPAQLLRPSRRGPMPV